MFPSMDVWYMIDIIRYIAIQNMKYKTLIVNFTQQVVRSAEWALRRFSPRLLQSRRSSASRFSLGSRSLQIDIFVLLSQHQDCIWIKHIQFIYEYNTFISSKDILLRRTVSRFFSMLLWCMQTWMDFWIFRLKLSPDEHLGDGQRGQPGWLPQDGRRLARLRWHRHEEGGQAKYRIS